MVLFGKRYWCHLAAISVFVTLLAGCSDGDPKTPTTTVSPEPTSSSTSATPSADNESATELAEWLEDPVGGAPTHVGYYEDFCFEDKPFTLTFAEWASSFVGRWESAVLRPGPPPTDEAAAAWARWISAGYSWAQELAWGQHPDITPVLDAEADLAETLIAGGVPADQVHSTLDGSQFVPTDCGLAYDPPELSNETIAADAFGPIRFGATIEDTEQQLQARLVIEGYDFFDGRCYAVALPGVTEASLLAQGPAFQTNQGEIGRISVWEPGLSTAEGIQVGSTLDEVRAAHPNTTSEPHAYVDGLYVWVGTYPEDGPGTAIKFEIGEDDTVTAIHAGLNGAVALIEGCA